MEKLHQKTYNEALQCMRNQGFVKNKYNKI